MENNNNGRGIFYGVIGVATLVVAIIGATFAYFSAQVGANDAINVASTTVNLRMTGIESNFKTNMIPVDTYFDSNLDLNSDGKYDGAGEHAANTANTAFYTFPGLKDTGTGAGTCVDLVGNSICGVYTFTIENPNATTSQYVEGSITFTANTGFANMKYAVFKGKPSKTTGDGGITSYDVNATLAATATGEGASKTPAAVGTLVAKGTVPAMTDTQNLTQKWTNTNELLDPSGTTSYTVVVWLEDTGAAQDAEQGKVFAASILFKSPDGQGVTGVLTSAS